MKKTLIILILIYLATVSIIDALKHPELTSTQRALRLHKAVVLDFDI